MADSGTKDAALFGRAGVTQLLGMNNTPTDVTFSFRGFAQL
jgi:hypothetical protein